jgi:hypothetical protein
VAHQGATTGSDTDAGVLAVLETRMQSARSGPAGLTAAEAERVARFTEARRLADGTDREQTRSGD